MSKPQHHPRVLPSLNPLQTPDYVSTHAWSSDNCPIVISQLPEALVDYAIAEGNSLRAAGLDDQRASSLAVARAWEWHEEGSPEPDDFVPGPARFVSNASGRWLISNADGEVSHEFCELEDALSRAAQLAGEDAGTVYVYADGALVDILSFSQERTGLASPTMYHVVQHEDGWALTRLAGEHSHFEHFERKSDAVAAGRQLARQNLSELRIHRVDGSVQDEHDYRVHH